MADDSELWPFAMCPPTPTPGRSYELKEPALNRRLAMAGRAVWRKIFFWSFVYIVFLLSLPA
jgi:hypothetical protein